MLRKTAVAVLIHIYRFHIFVHCKGYAHVQPFISTFLISHHFACIVFTSFFLSACLSSVI